MKHSVSVTGIGVVSPLGLNSQTLFSALMNGQSGLRLLSAEDSNSITTVAGTIDFDSSPWFTQTQLSGVDRVSQFAVAAAEMAVSDSFVQREDLAAAGCYMGCGMGGAVSLEYAYAKHFSENPRLSPLTVVSTMTNAAAANVSIRFGIRGPVLTYSIACASSSVAIGEAYRAIASGSIDRALAGGAESLLVSGVIRAWQSMRTLARVDVEKPETSCRPFSNDRSGLVLAEGSAVLVLERTELAKARGARIYAEIVGYGLSCDANHLAKPDQVGQVLALRSALREANLSPTDIGYVNAHGTATKIGDLVESASLHEVWQQDLKLVKVSSTKSMHGHMLGAAGALESAITILSLYHRQIPPNAFCQLQDPECNLPLVVGSGIEAPNLTAALNNSFAFGGTNAVLAFSRSRQV